MSQQLNIRSATQIWESADRTVAVPVFIFELRQAPAWPTPTGDVITTWGAVAEGAGFGLVLDPAPGAIAQSVPRVSEQSAWVDLRYSTSLTLFMAMPTTQDNGAVFTKLNAAGKHQIGSVTDHDRKFRSLVAQNHQVLVLFGMDLDIDASAGENSGDADIGNAVNRGNLYGGWLRAVS